MKGKKFSEEQIIGVLKESEAVAKTKDLCRRHGISEATFLQLEGQVRGNDRLRGTAAEGAGSGEREAQAIAGGCRTG